MSGLTLFELIVVIAIIGILSYLSVPTLRHFIVKQRLDHYARRLQFALQLARSEAIRLNAKVIFCGGDIGHLCNGQWQQGQAIMRDAKVLKFFNRLPASYPLCYKGSFARNAKIIFSAYGFTQGQRGSFYLCHARKHNKQCLRLVLQPTGQLRIK